MQKQKNRVVGGERQRADEREEERGTERGIEGGRESEKEKEKETPNFYLNLKP